MGGGEFPVADERGHESSPGFGGQFGRWAVDWIDQSSQEQTSVDFGKLRFERNKSQADLEALIDPSQTGG